MKIFAEKLKELRKERELSQMSLAKETGLTQSAIKHWEVEKSIPNALAVVILAKFFEVSADYLLGLKDY